MSSLPSRLKSPTAIPANASKEEDWLPTGISPVTEIAVWNVPSPLPSMIEAVPSELMMMARSSWTVAVEVATRHMGRGATRNHLTSGLVLTVPKRSHPPLPGRKVTSPKFSVTKSSLPSPLKSAWMTSPGPDPTV